MKAIVALCLGIISSVNAATIAVIDSGMDAKHEQIIPNLWSNPEISESGPYKNVINGWNFTNKSNRIIDEHLIGSFSPDIKKFYDLLAQNFLFSITEEEKAWAKEKQQDKEFVKQLNLYGTFVHGTHVAGISVKNSRNKAMGVTLLSTNATVALNELRAERGVIKSIDADPWEEIETVIGSLAIRQMATLKEIGHFIHSHNADIANGSFGTSYDSALYLAYRMALSYLRRMPTDEELDKIAKMYLSALVRVGNTFVSAAPKTLFVFAAGNDGRNNDEFGFSPSNIKADNTISVAATYEDMFLAPFSNWGTQMVEVAAPGMMIHSSIPGNEYLRVSGTSQAAPFVANVAGQVKDANTALTPGEIKKIIMGTVDKKMFLLIRVKTGGMVNRERAVVAAKLSRVLPIQEAIERANNQIPAKSYLKSRSDVNRNVIPMPMPSDLVF